MDKWLNLPEAARYCGFGKTKFREFVIEPDFPKPTNPTGHPKGRRWRPEWLDAWLETRTEE